MGSWLVYGLGSENENLPAYLVLRDPASLPVLGAENWQNTWLPSACAGTVIHAQEPRIANLQPPGSLRGGAQKRILSYLDQINRRHLERHPGEADLAARLKSYSLAAGMQVEAQEALDISGETAETQALYGIDDPVTKDFGTRCLIARRLVERGVRFVQVLTGDQHWDHHGGIVGALPKVCRRVDKPAAALVRDLKRLGMLDTTLVHWGGEMGRLPVIQFRSGKGNRNAVGRDHNTYGFTQWVAGGGFRKGYIHGETDEFSHYAVKDVVHHYDWLATVLHQFGLDHDKLKFRSGPGDIRLVEDEKARVVRELLG